jgi:hypothetical protein
MPIITGKVALRLLILATLLLVCPSLTRAQQLCPNVDPEQGYPVIATSPTPSADAEWLESVAHAAAYRWRVPSSRRNEYAGWERVRNRRLPPEPRWADDWGPDARHRAVVHLTLSRDPARSQLQLVSGSGDRRFDRSLESIVREPMPGSPPLPQLPSAYDGDSLIVALEFGHAAATEPHGMVRFAAAQTRGELHRNTLRVDPPPGHRGPFPQTTVKYDVLETGRVDPSSIEFVRSQGRQFEEVIRNGLLMARFSPPTSNCRPIAQSFVQTFGN